MKNYQILFTKPKTAALLESEIDCKATGDNVLVRTEYTAISAGTERDNLRDEPNLYCVSGERKRRHSHGTTVIAVLQRC